MLVISQKGARKWLEGEAMPRLSRIAQIAGRCGVNGEWLLTGQGAMRPGGAERNLLKPAESCSALPLLRLQHLLDRAYAEGRLSEADLSAIEHLVVRVVEY